MNGSPGAKFALRFGALLGATGVAAGAFGAHALRSRLAPRDLEIFETAVRYQLVHALALLLCAALALHGLRTRFATHAFIWGSIIFSGTLYILVLANIRWLGAITPIGGTALIVGWIALAFSGSERN